MIQLAFKIAAKAGSKWSEMIAAESNSIYSHVEIWLNGPASKAYCFSSREPDGAGFATLDLTDGMWDVFPVSRINHDQERMTWGYCFGAQGKWYNMVGLIGYKLSKPAVNDPAGLFCSQTVADVARWCWGDILTKEPWQISPGEMCDLNKQLEEAYRGKPA